MFMLLQSELWLAVFAAVPVCRGTHELDGHDEHLDPAEGCSPGTRFLGRAPTSCSDRKGFWRLFSHPTLSGLHYSMGEHTHSNAHTHQHEYALYAKKLYLKTSNTHLRAKLLFIAKLSSVIFMTWIKCSVYDVKGTFGTYLWPSRRVRPAQCIDTWWWQRQVGDKWPYLQSHTNVCVCVPFIVEF